MNPTLNNFLDAFLPSFNSCKLNILATEENGELYNFLTTIIFLSGYTQEHDEKVEKGFGHKEQIFFYFHTLKPQQCYEYLEEIGTKGNIRPSHIDNIYYEQFNLLELQITRYEQPSSIAPEWKIFSIIKNRNPNTATVWNKIDNGDGKARLLGYMDIYDLIRRNFRVVNFQRGDQKEFIIYIPVIAKIQELSPSKVNVVKHEALNNLQINIFQKSQGGNSVPIDSSTADVGKAKLIEKGLCNIEIEIKDFKKLKPNDVIQATLIEKTIPEIELDTKYITIPLKNAVEPFTKTLFEFYPLDEFKKHLLEPENYRDADMVFQDAVVQLLSLIGLPVVVLGGKQYKETERKKSKKYEELKLESGYVIGSADLINYEENKQLLFIDCTTKIPDDKKIKNMQEIVNHFSYIKEKFGNLRIFSLIFTPKNYGHEYIREVGIVDKSRINNLLNLALEGKAEVARGNLYY
jgi:hypothetical protein